MKRRRAKKEEEAQKKAMEEGGSIMPMGKRDFIYFSISS